MRAHPFGLAGDVNRCRDGIASFSADVSSDRFSLIPQDICDNYPGTLLSKEPRFSLTIPCAAPVTIATLSFKRMAFLLIPPSVSFALYTGGKQQPREGMLR